MTSPWHNQGRIHWWLCPPGPRNCFANKTNQGTNYSRENPRDKANCKHTAQDAVQFVRYDCEDDSTASCAHLLQFRRVLKI